MVFWQQDLYCPSSEPLPTNAQGGNISKTGVKLFDNYLSFCTSCTYKKKLQTHYEILTTNHVGLFFFIKNTMIYYI